MIGWPDIPSFVYGLLASLLFALIFGLDRCFKRWPEWEDRIYMSRAIRYGDMDK